MSSPLRKVALYLGLVDDGSEGVESPTATPATTASSSAVHAPQSSVKSGGSRFFGSRNEASAPALNPSPATPARFRAVESVTPVFREEPVLDRIITLHPHSYNDARVIGEHYRDHTPVIMNLTDMDDADAKRLVDFAAGLVFGHRGSIERVTAKVFLLSPPNVKVSAEDKFAAAEASFFNQS
jgi:cell division inhibitor SepF